MNPEEGGVDGRGRTLPGLRDQGWGGVWGGRGRRPLRSSKKDSASAARDRRRRGLGGPSNSGVISMKSGAGLTGIVIPISKEFGLKLQETTQQVVKEMSMLLHTLLSKFSRLAVLAHQILLPEGVPLPSTREVVPIVISGRRKTTVKEDGVVHVRGKHSGAEGWGE